eukprot:31534-Pelagococcus_subviridis.AAC.16
MQKVVERVRAEQVRARPQRVARDHRVGDGGVLRRQQRRDHVHDLHALQPQRRRHRAPRRPLLRDVARRLERGGELRQRRRARERRGLGRLPRRLRLRARLHREERLHRLRGALRALAVDHADRDVEDVHQGRRGRAAVRRRRRRQPAVAVVQDAVAARRRRRRREPAFEELRHRRRLREFRRERGRRRARDADEHLRGVRRSRRGGVALSLFAAVNAAVRRPERVEEPVEEIRLREPLIAVVAAAAAHAAAQPSHHPHPQHVHRHHAVEHLRDREDVHASHQRVDEIFILLKKRDALAPAPGHDARHRLAEEAREHRVQGGAVVHVHEGHYPREERAVIVHQRVEHRVDLARKDLAREVRVFELASRVRVLGGRVDEVADELLHDRARLQAATTGWGGRGGGGSAGRRRSIGRAAGEERPRADRRPIVARRVRPHRRSSSSSSDEGSIEARRERSRRVESDLSRRSHAQVHEPRVQALALLDEVVLVQEVVQGERLAVEDAIDGRRLHDPRRAPKHRDRRRAAPSPSRSRARTPSTRDPIAGARSELRVRALLLRVGGRVCTREALCAARRRDASRGGASGEFDENFSALLSQRQGELLDRDDGRAKSARPHRFPFNLSLFSINFPGTPYHDVITSHASVTLFPPSVTSLFPLLFCPSKSLTAQLVASFALNVCDSSTASIKYASNPVTFVTFFGPRVPLSIRTGASSPFLVASLPPRRTEICGWNRFVHAATTSLALIDVGASHRVGSRTTCPGGHGATAPPSPPRSKPRSATYASTTSFALSAVYSPSYGYEYEYESSPPPSDDSFTAANTALIAVDEPGFNTFESVNFAGFEPLASSRVAAAAAAPLYSSGVADASASAAAATPSAASLAVSCFAWFMMSSCARFTLVTAISFVCLSSFTVSHPSFDLTFKSLLSFLCVDALTSSVLPAPARRHGTTCCAHSADPNSGSA